MRGQSCKRPKYAPHYQPLPLTYFLFRFHCRILSYLSVILPFSTYSSVNKRRHSLCVECDVMGNASASFKYSVDETRLHARNMNAESHRIRGKFGLTPILSWPLSANRRGMGHFDFLFFRLLFIITFFSLHVACFVRGTMACSLVACNAITVVMWSAI